MQWRVTFASLQLYYSYNTMQGELSSIVERAINKTDALV